MRYRSGGRKGMHAEGACERRGGGWGCSSPGAHPEGGGTWLGSGAGENPEERGATGQRRRQLKGHDKHSDLSGTM